MYLLVNVQICRLGSTLTNENAPRHIFAMEVDRALVDVMRPGH